MRLTGWYPIYFRSVWWIWAKCSLRSFEGMDVRVIEHSENSTSIILPFPNNIQVAQLSARDFTFSSKNRADFIHLSSVEENRNLTGECEEQMNSRNRFRSLILLPSSSYSIIHSCIFGPTESWSAQFAAKRLSGSFEKRRTLPSSEDFY